MKYAHLSAGFMLTSIVGFFMSVFLVWKMSISWGVAFALFFIAMFVASILSMTHADFTDEEYQQELAIHEKPSYKRRKNHIFK
jgi:multisubunit Na+/H+ antiporter MnhE subunit